jgi:hypothetical protein
MSHARITVLVLLSSFVTVGASEVPLGSLLAHPKQYHGQRVSVTGFAHVDGESFVLYRDKASAKRLDVRALSVAQRRNSPLHDYLNNRWVTATGIVDAEAHGLWNFPCELLLDEAHAVRHQ